MWPTELQPAYRLPEARSKWKGSTTRTGVYFFATWISEMIVYGLMKNKNSHLLDQILPDNLENLVLLEHLTRDVEGQILRVDNPLHKVEIFRDDLLAVVHDEHPPHVQLDVVLLLLVLEEIEGGALGDEHKGTELQLT